MRAKSYVEEIVDLRRRLDDALEENRLLREQLSSPPHPNPARRAIGLSPQEFSMLEIVRRVSPNIATFERLEATARTAEWPRKVVAVQMYNLRKKLRRFGVLIAKEHSISFYLDAENKARIDALLGGSQ